MIADSALMKSVRRPLGLEMSIEHRGLWWQAGLATLLAAPYGATIGWWTSPRLAIYAAIKLPLVMLVTALLTLVACWSIARLVGWRVSLSTTAGLIGLPLAVASVVLASLAPVSLLLSSSAPAPDGAARLTHNLLYLAHTTLVGAAALGGMTVLWRLLVKLVAGRERARLVFALWLAIYAIVGGEVAWSMRPFVGSVYEEVRFLRPNALDGNVYEFVLADIVPYLQSKTNEERQND